MPHASWLVQKRLSSLFYRAGERPGGIADLFQARALLEAPPENTLKGKRDRAILATFLHHGLRSRGALQPARPRPAKPPGRAPPADPGQGLEGPLRAGPPARGLERIHEYLEAAGHGKDADGLLFRSLKNPAGQGKTDRSLTQGAVYHRVLRKHAKAAGIDGKSFGPHALRATAATDALDRGADLAQGPGMALATPTRPPTGSTTGAAPGPKTVPPSAWPTLVETFLFRSWAAR